MRGKVWVYDPHSGGVKIPPAVRQRTTERIEKHARAKYPGKFTRLDIRFRGALGHIFFITEKTTVRRKKPSTWGRPICRIQRAHPWVVGIRRREFLALSYRFVKEPHR
jgi:hypothetical protein